LGIEWQEVVAKNAKCKGTARRGDKNHGGK
jgi:hypothetical protein